jgi:uncharacterized membrane protein
MNTAREIADLAFRWIHVIAAIMWIGNSLLFNWLDRNLKPAARPSERSMGEIWLLHSGAFYQVEKTLSVLPDGLLPEPLHWFKWQAYTTWLSGAVLLALVYYATGGALLVNPAAGLHPHVASAIGVGVIVGGLVIYEAMFRSPLRHVPAIGAAIGFVLLLALTWWLTTVFTGRAAFLHVGALMGTLMAANVMLHIMPSQRSFVAAAARGEPVDKRLSDHAKIRSIHNNYLTFPVVALMVSSHFPSLYSAPLAWAALGAVVAAGAGFRHLLNVRFTFGAWKPAFAVLSLATVGALWALTSPTGLARQPPAGGSVAGLPGGPVDAALAEAIIAKRCTACHSASPAIRSYGPSPGGAAFDSRQQLEMWRARIGFRAVETRTMPPGNETGLTEQERAIIGAWSRGH